MCQDLCIPRPCLRTEPSEGKGVGSPEPSARLWAQEQFGRACLGDKRLTNRLVDIGAMCAQRPHDSLPQASDGWAATKGAYRFIANERVKKEAILQSVFEATARRCLGRETILCVQDTTTLTFPTAHEAAQDMGYITGLDLAGMLVHSTMALRSNGVPLGLLDVQIWNRDPDELGKRGDHKERPIEEKESFKWLRGIEAVGRVFSDIASEKQQPRCVHVMDREGDIHEVFESIIQGGHGAVIRVAQNRRVRDEQGQLDKTYAVARAQEPLGQRTVEVRRKGSRKARQAATVVRACAVNLAPNDSHNPQRGPLPLWLVELVEPHAPEGIEPLHWLLWTSEPVRTLDEALNIVGIYEMRWKIEDYHLTLKSGCGVEKLRMHTAKRISKTLAIYAPVAARIVELRDLARLEPKAACTEALSDLEWRALWTAIHKAPPSAKTAVPSIKQAVLWIGRLGGHLGRKGDGMPGVITLWRGLRDLQLLTSMYETFHPTVPPKSAK